VNCLQITATHQRLCRQQDHSSVGRWRSGWNVIFWGTNRTWWGRTVVDSWLWW